MLDLCYSQGEAIEHVCVCACTHVILAMKISPCFRVEMFVCVCGVKERERGRSKTHGAAGRMSDAHFHVKGLPLLRPSKEIMHALL